MNINHLLLLLALLIPLTVDTFVVSAALGLAGLPKKHHLRTSLTLAAFEAAMPAIGVLLGILVSDFTGKYTSYIAGAIIAAAGLLLLKPEGQDEIGDKESKLVSKTQGFAIIGLGISISIDELALGLSLGLLHVPLGLAATLIGLQAFVASQLGLRLGQKLSERFREHAEKMAGIVLIAIGAVIIGLELSGHNII